MASVVAIGVMTGTLVQLPSDLYNGVCISGIKEDDAYRLAHCATCARSPPKPRKTQTVAQSAEFFYREQNIPLFALVG